MTRRFEAARTLSRTWHRMDGVTLGRYGAGLFAGGARQ
jgi:hypothetical protein